MPKHPNKHSIYIPEWEDLEKLAASETARIGFEVAPGTLVRRAVRALLKNPEKILKLSPPIPKIEN